MRDAFYKYLNAESLKMTLSSATRKWSSPFEFNDPFDNYIDLKAMEDPRDVESKMAAMIWNYLDNPNLDLSILPSETRFIISAFKMKNMKTEKEVLEELTGIYTHEYLDKMRSRFNETTREALSDISIFCITEEYDNLLMWAHYAENHKGGVIKLLPVKEIDSPLLVAKKVTYSLSVPFFSFFDVIQNTIEFRRKIIDAVTLTKGQDWAYEKEWRIVYKLRDSENKYEIIPFAEQEIGAVYLGCRIAEADKKEVLSLINGKYPWASVYQAEPKRSEFSLDFKKVR